MAGASPDTPRLGDLPAFRQLATRVPRIGGPPSAQAKEDGELLVSPLAIPGAALVPDSTSTYGRGRIGDATAASRIGFHPPSLSIRATRASGTPGLSRWRKGKNSEARPTTDLGQGRRRSPDQTSRVNYPRQWRATAWRHLPKKLSGSARTPPGRTTLPIRPRIPAAVEWR
jgi:hypothetical protein